MSAGVSVEQRLVAVQNEFSAGLAEIWRFLSLADALSDHAATRTLLMSSHVLAVAQTEGFLKKILEAHVEALNESMVPFAKVPDSLRELHTMALLVEVSSCPEQERHRKLRRLRMQLNKYWDDERVSRPGSGAFNAGLVKRQLTSADPEKVSTAFRILGCEGVKQVFESDFPVVPDEAMKARLGIADLGVQSEEDDSFESITTLRAREKMTEIVRDRNVIAHGNGFPQISADDVRTTLKFLSVWSDAVVQSMLELAAQQAIS